MLSRRGRAQLGLVAVAVLWATVVSAASVDPYTLLGQLILPRDVAGADRKEARTGLEELGAAAVPALVEATYYGQILTWTLPARLSPGQAMVLTYQATLVAVPLELGLITTVAAAVTGEVSLTVRKDLSSGARGVVGETVEFRLTVSHTGSEPITAVTVADVLYEWLVYVPGSARATWPDGGAAGNPKIDDAAWVRWDAVNTLGNLAYKDPQAARPGIPALVARALTDINPHPQWRSLWALGTFGKEIIAAEVVPLIRKGLENDDPRIVWQAAVGLAFFGQVEAAPYLNRGLYAANDMQRWEAVYCLGMVHNEESLLLLIPMVTDVEGCETRIRQEVALTLGKIGDPRAVPALVAALRDPQSAVRWRAAMSLVRFRDPSVIPAIQEALALETDSWAIEQMQKAIADLLKGK